MGFAYTKKLKKAKEELRLILLFLERFKTQIRFYRRSLFEGLSTISKDLQFSSLSFIGEAAIYMKEQPFPEAWERAVINWQGEISDEDKKRLASLSGILGAFDVQGQTDALEILEEEFERSYKQQQELVQTKGKLVRSLGLLMAAGLFVLVI